MHSRERVAVPALFENTNRKSTRNASQPMEPTAMEFVLSIDPTAKFYHYGPQGCRSGWIQGDGWETSITWCERQAWENARMALHAAADPRPRVKDRAPAVQLTPGGMYPKEVDAEGHTLHSKHCKAAFSRRDWQCHRCCELQLGALPRTSGHAEYFRRKLNEVQKVFLFPHDAAKRS